MAIITASIKSAIVLACALNAATIKSGGADQRSAQSGCHTYLPLAAAVDPEPRLSVAAKPFILSFAGLIFLRDGTVERVQEIEPFELRWGGPGQGGFAARGIRSSLLMEMRLLDMPRSVVELTAKDGSVSIVSAVTQGDQNNRRTLADRLAGITYRVKRFNTAREAYEQHWRFTPWKDIDTVMFVGTPGVKRCPVDDRRFPGFYRFSPYTGTELVWEGQGPTSPPSTPFGECLESIARSKTLCGSCAGIETDTQCPSDSVRSQEVPSTHKVSVGAKRHSGTN